MFRPLSRTLCVLTAATATGCLEIDRDVDPDLAWTRCGLENAVWDGPYECGTLQVPVDWADPEGTSIRLSLARLPASDSEDRIGAVLVLSGGPGGSGIDDLPTVAAGLGAVRARFDLVAHEPRTALALQTAPEACHQPPGIVVDLPRDSIHYQEMLAPLTAAVQRCRRQLGNGLLDHLDGASQARDIEALRRALNEETLSLTAQSYGGIVVATYARIFPSRIRAAFVDGVASHPDYPFVRGPQTQLRAFRQFASWCEGTSSCALYGEDIPTLWRDLTVSANETPILGIRNGSVGKSYPAPNSTS